MNTRAKFSCVQIKRSASYANDGTHEILLTPVSSGSEENREFYKWTPSGEIRLNVVSSQTASQFKERHDYYVDFTEVPE